MAYVAQKPALSPPSDELRARIPGWGVDMDFADRPGVPKENFDPGATGAHWDFPERQEAVEPRERSVEHRFLTPVFGTTCPPRGISGAVRRYAYRFSEGQARHWLLLMGADRIDVVENRISALMSGRPDSRVMESGVLSEFKYGGVRSRLGQNRADVKHVWMDAAAFLAPYLALAGAAYLISQRRRGRAR